MRILPDRDPRLRGPPRQRPILLPTREAYRGSEYTAVSAFQLQCEPKGQKKLVETHSQAPKKSENNAWTMRIYVHIMQVKMIL